MTVPVVSITAEPKVFIEGEGNRGSFVLTLSEPAPEGGLTLNLGTFEEDGAAGDDTIELENIDSFTLNALGLTSSVTISEGATEARLTAVSLGDDLPEDDESTTIFLIETPEYQVDPRASEATLIETDVPIVSLSVEAPTIDENGVGIFPEGAGNSASFVFNLSEPAPAGGLILNIATFEQDGAAGDDILETENIDSFSENALGLPSSITISEGATEARLTLVSLGDDIPEGPEETTTFLIDAIGYTADPDASEATLIETDEVSDITTVSVTPERLIATEGETFAWNFSLDQPAPEGGLEIFLPQIFNNDPPPGDVDFFVDGSSNISDFELVVRDNVSIGTKLTIAEGETEATLVALAVPDDIEEIRDEFFTSVIADGENYRANPEQNQVTTVITEFPVVSISPEEVTAVEGETFAWNFSLNHPAPEGGLSLFLPITANNDPPPGDVDFFVDGSSNISDFEFVVEDNVSIGFNITIAEGATEATLVSEVVADDLDEETEIFTTVIADGVDYRANPEQNQVTTSLLETTKPSFTFIPGGTQSDDDLIDDFATNEGETLSLLSQIDTTGLTAPLTFLEFENNFDTNELDKTGLEVLDNEVFDITLSEPVVDPDTGLSTQKVTFTAINDGQAPNTVLDRDIATYQVIGLNNDGIRDLDIVVTSAIDADGNDVTGLFQPPFEFEVQTEL